MDTYIDETIVATAAIEDNLDDELIADENQTAVMIVNADNESNEEVDPNDDSVDYEDDSKRGISDIVQTRVDSALEGVQDLDDIIIAEAVQVTQYSCKFCNRRFDSIDKVKNHYLLRHNETATKAVSNSGRLKKENNDDTDYTPASKRRRPARPVQRNYKIEIIGDVDDEDLNISGGSSKKRGRKPTGVKRKYPCDWPACNYVARHSVHLKDHKRTHTGEKPYRCNWPDCGHSFVQGSALKTHIRTHTGEKPYPCEWPGCTLRFSQKNNVKVHMRTHTGEKPYVCDWPGCEWRFAIKGNLDEHKRVHAGEKFFICDWPGCTRSYTQNSHLRRHRLIHTEEKPFACDWPNCTYRSVRSCDVQNHRVTHTGEKRFVCDFPECGKAFTRAHHLRRHLITNHSVEAEDEVSYVEDNGNTEEEQVIAADEILEHEEQTEEQEEEYLE